MTDSTTAPEITPDLTMAEILTRVPAAQRALFQRYHVGGCSSCGFEPTDTLAAVCKERNLLDVNEVVDTILRAHEVDQKLLLAPGEAAQQLESGALRLLDVRSADEWDAVHVEGSERLDFNASSQYMELPKATPLVFLCKTGEDARCSSKDVASYFIGHGFTNVRAVAGGLDAWREQVDPSLADYALE